MFDNVCASQWVSQHCITRAIGPRGKLVMCIRDFPYDNWWPCTI